MDCACNSTDSIPNFNSSIYALEDDCQLSAENEHIKMSFLWSMKKAILGAIFKSS